MSLKTKLILGAGVLAAIGIGIGLELHIAFTNAFWKSWSRFASKASGRRIFQLHYISPELVGAIS